MNSATITRKINSARGKMLNALKERLATLSDGFGNDADFHLTLVKGMNHKRMSQADVDTLISLSEQYGLPTE